MNLYLIKLFYHFMHYRIHEIDQNGITVHIGAVLNIEQDVTGKNKEIICCQNISWKGG